jgi:hypothetical protein
VAEKKKAKTASKTSPKPKRPAAPKKAAKTPAKSRPMAAKTTKKTAAPKAPKAAKAAPQVSKPVWPKLKSSDLPPKKWARQGETQMVAFIRDPQCIFTYWEVTPESIEAVKAQLMEEYQGSSMVLRVLKVSPEGDSQLLYEVEVDPGEMNRYLELKEPGGVYFVEVARRTPSGKVVAYARSNRIVTGPSGASWPPASDPKWEPPSGILEYFSEEGEETSAFPAPGGASSVDSMRRKKARYNASNIQ